MTDFDELQVNDSSYTKGTNSLVMSELMPNGWLVVLVTQMGAIKFAMAGT